MERKITTDMLSKAYDDGVLAIIDGNEICDCTHAVIGDDHFYFGGFTAEELSAKEYIENVGKDDIIEEVFAVIDNDFKIDDYDGEYMYLYSVLASYE